MILVGIRMLKVKIKLFFKNIFKNIKIYLGLPHFWILFIVIILATGFLILSFFYRYKSSFLSSIFSNVFAGLITGVVLSLISTVKAIDLYRTECLIKWLEDIHADCLSFIDLRIKFIRREDFDSYEEFDNYIYDALCCGNDICVKISQGQFDKSLPFNSYKYCKKNFSFDTIIISEKNEKLHEKILNSDLSNFTQKDLFNLFEEMENQIWQLNRGVVSKISKLKIKKKAINISVG